MGFLRAVIIVIVLLSTSCTTANGRYTKGGAATVGGVVGGLTGAGSGALVGAIISRGDIAASALLGTAIGIPVGAVLGIYYLYTVENREVNENQDVIDYNADLIRRRQEKINRLKNQTDSEAQSIKLDPKKRQEIYTGPTLGSPR